MCPPVVRSLALGCALGLTAPATLPAQAPPADQVVPAAPTSDSAKAAADPEEGKLKIYGFVTGSYTISSHAVDRHIVGRFYDRFSGEFMANAAKLVFEENVATDRLDAGFRADFLFGQNATVTQSRGFNLGQNADLLQAMAVLNVPLGEGKYVQFKGGKMETLIGMELMEDALNPNFSIGNQFVYLENFTYTGIGVDLRVSPVVDFTLRYFNGWDLVQDNNKARSFMGRIGITPGGSTSLGFIGYLGPEQDNNTDNWRYGTELTLIQKLGTRAQLWVELDAGKEEGLSSPSDPNQAIEASWWGAAAWLTYEAGRKTQLAFRADYVDDTEGVRTSGVYYWPVNDGNRFGSVTGTLNWKVYPGFLIRPEVRYDFSNLAAFDGNKSQVTFATALTYMF